MENALNRMSVLNRALIEPKRTIDSLNALVALSASMSAADGPGGPLISNPSRTLVRTYRLRLRLRLTSRLCVCANRCAVLFSALCCALCTGEGTFGELDAKGETASRQFFLFSDSAVWSAPETHTYKGSADLVACKVTDVCGLSHLCAVS